MNNEALKQALEAAYLAGFNASGEGYNGEYPFGDHARNPAQDEGWCQNRDAYIRKALAEQPAQTDWEAVAADQALTIALLKAEQPAQQQEPVAWATQMGEYAHIQWGAKRPEYPMVYEFPLYTSPPPRKPWVGLTQEDIDIAFDDTQEGGGFDDFARAIEAKLKEKNA